MTKLFTGLALVKTNFLSISRGLVLLKFENLFTGLIQYLDDNEDRLDQFMVLSLVTGVFSIIFGIVALNNIKYPRNRHIGSFILSVIAIGVGLGFIARYSSQLDTQNINY